MYFIINGYYTENININIKTLQEFIMNGGFSYCLDSWKSPVMITHG